MVESPVILDATSFMWRRCDETKIFLTDSSTLTYLCSENKLESQGIFFKFLLYTLYPLSEHFKSVAWNLSIIDVLCCVHARLVEARYAVLRVNS